MDHQPPPFFKRGPAPLAQLSFYAALSVSLLFVDLRFHTLEIIRQGISLITHPLQKVAQSPIALLNNTGGYFSDVSQLEAENTRLKHLQMENARELLRTQQLESENIRLRRLLEIKERQKLNGRIAQILYAARDPYSRKVVIDRGINDNIITGQPVIDDAGVVGQVTRIFPFVSEVTLITDKNQAVPVQVIRNGLRSVVFGLGTGKLELRFMPINADIQEGDMLVTSGLDTVFLPGLPVARVLKVERDASYSFARIYCEPIASAENFGEVIVLDPQAVTPLPEELTEEKSEKKTASKKRRNTARRR